MNPVNKNQKDLSAFKSEKWKLKFFLLVKKIWIIAGTLPTK